MVGGSLRRRRRTVVTLGLHAQAAVIATFLPAAEENSSGSRRACRVAGVIPQRCSEVERMRGSGSHFSPPFEAAGMVPPPMRILSGIQSSGRLHIGNYYGAIAQFLE